jgi:hypothetical protein
MLIAPMPRSPYTRAIRTVTWVVFVVIAWIAQPVHAQETPEPPAQETPEPPAQETPEPPATPLDVGHDAVGRTLSRIARAMDRFFSESTEYTDTKGSWARLRLNALARENGVHKFTTDFAVRLALPHTAKKFNLVLESDDESYPTGFRDPLSASTSPVYSGGMRYILADTKDTHAHVDVGAEFGNPIDAFLRGRAIRTFHWGKWQLRAAETLTWYQSNRKNSLTELTLDRLLAPDWLWREFVGARIAHPTSETKAVVSSSVYHRIDERHALQFELLGRGLDDPARVSAYEINLRYRWRSKKRNWLYYEIQPQEYYSEFYSFKPLASIYFRIEFLFRG